MEPQWSEWERKVLANFLEGETIRRLPARQKKRRVILKWLTVRFPAGVKMPHQTLNLALLRHHPDSATLRRELVEFGYMHRDRDSYWRADTLPEYPTPASELRESSE